jgi:hypothetical protein
MGDTIHKKKLKKDYPHFDKFYVGSKQYGEGYDRIFKKKTKKRRVRKNDVQPK